MQVKCVKPFGAHAAGDVAEVPDGAEVSPVYYEPLHARPDGSPPPDDPPPSDTPPPAVAGSFGQPKDN